MDKRPNVGGDGTPRKRGKGNQIMDVTAFPSFGPKGYNEKGELVIGLLEQPTKMFANLLKSAKTIQKFHCPDSSITSGSGTRNSSVISRDPRIVEFFGARNAFTKTPDPKIPAAAGADTSIHKISDSRTPAALGAATSGMMTPYPRNPSALGAHVGFLNAPDRGMSAADGASIHHKKTPDPPTISSRGAHGPVMNAIDPRYIASLKAQKSRLKAPDPTIPAAAGAADSSLNAPHVHIPALLDVPTFATNQENQTIAKSKESKSITVKHVGIQVDAIELKFRGQPELLCKDVDVDTSDLSEIKLVKIGPVWMPFTKIEKKYYYVEPNQGRLEELFVVTPASVIARADEILLGNQDNTSVNPSNYAHFDKKDWSLRFATCPTACASETYGCEHCGIKLNSLQEKQHHENNECKWPGAPNATCEGLGHYRREYRKHVKATRLVAGGWNKLEIIIKPTAYENQAAKEITGTTQTVESKGGQATKTKHPGSLAQQIAAGNVVITPITDTVTQ